MKEVFEKYGSDWTLIKPDDIFGFALHFSIAVPNNRNWQIEEYVKSDGEVNLEQVVRFADSNGNVLSMTIEPSPKLINKGNIQFNFSEEEITQLKEFIKKNGPILILNAKKNILVRQKKMKNFVKNFESSFYLKDLVTVKKVRTVFTEKFS